MMKKTVLVSLITMLTFILYFCTNQKKDHNIPVSGLSGENLAHQYCSSCHEIVGPKMLTKSIWKEDVLPAMGHRLGIYAGGIRPDSLFERGSGGVVTRDANIFPEVPLLAQEDWVKIVDYYISQAPDTLNTARNHQEINQGLKHFTYKEAQYSLRPPLTTLVKILPDNRGIVYADTKPGINKLVFLNKDLYKDSELNFKTAPVHYAEKSDTLHVLTIGKNPFPNDRIDGDLQIIYKGAAGEEYNKSKIILPDLKRPVYVEYGDIDQDGLEDVVVCEFGNYTGQLSWYHNKGDGQYDKHILRDAPGAIHTVLADFNKDGHLDILALMSQGQEGLFYYENKGADPNAGPDNQLFTEKQLLSFSPLYGSQYFQLCDFNQDGHLDVLYVCGDNADKTPILKDYHGIYIYLNDGNGNLTQKYFYPQNGAYKAIAADFDLDGDLDVVSISFFPDYVDRPEESFVYLENTGNMEFTPFSFPEATRGRWMVMDVADMDGDGDLDIVLGSFVYFIAQGDTTGLGEQWMKEGPSVVVLENTISHSQTN